MNLHSKQNAWVQKQQWQIYIAFI